MKSTTPLLLLSAALTLASSACVPEEHTYGDGYAPGALFPQADSERPNFGAAWIHLYDANARALPHGDVHQLSDGSYSVLQMPGGTRMDLLRISPEGIPLGTRSFEVPETYAGCPFMPNEETFTDDDAILSYGSSVFRVDLAEGGVEWVATVAGQLKHSSTGFWTVDGDAGSVVGATRLNVSTGATDVLDLSASPLATGEQLIGLRLVRDADEPTGQAFRSVSDASDVDLAVIATFLPDADGGSAEASVRVVDLQTGAERWAYRHRVGADRMTTARFAVVDGGLVVALDRHLLSLDLDTGAPRWSYRLDGDSKNYWEGFDDRFPILATADGREVRAFAKTGQYVRVDAASGERLAEAAIANTATERVGLQAVEAIGDDYFVGAGADSEVSLIDARTGEIVREFRGVRSEYHAPVGVSYEGAADRVVLAGGRGVYAIDAPATNVLP